MLVHQRVISKFFRWKHVNIVVFPCFPPFFVAAKSPPVLTLRAALDSRPRKRHGFVVTVTLRSCKQTWCRWPVSWPMPYMVTWLGYLHGIHVTINIAYMDPMGYGWKMPDPNRSQETQAMKKSFAQGFFMELPRKNRELCRWDTHPSEWWIVQHVWITKGK